MSFRDVTFAVEGRLILDRLSLDVERGETLVLLGRSGSGKTTALRLINRMLYPTSGSVLIDGQDNKGSDPIRLRRRVGYVLQEFGLMPHWTVEQNVSMVPRLLGWPQRRQHERAAELMNQIGLPIAEYGARYPRQLSGGQQQRAGIARALAAEPPLLLFDEPFGALDPVTRHEMQQQFIALRSQYNVASVFVTHDIAEALALGTKIAVLDGGRLETVVSPYEFFAVETPLAKAFRATLPNFGDLGRR